MARSPQISRLLHRENCHHTVDFDIPCQSFIDTPWNKSATIRALSIAANQASCFFLYWNACCTEGADTVVLARAFASAGLPVSKEPASLSHVDGKCPDGMTLIPWQAGKPVVWDVTVIFHICQLILSRHRHESQAPQQKLLPCTKRLNIPIYCHSSPFTQ